MQCSNNLELCDAVVVCAVEI